MATLDQHITARRDPDLLARVIAAAEQADVPNPQMWAEANIGRIVSVEIGQGNDAATVADVHAYAVATYEPTPRPGENPAAVTDDQVRAAVAAARGIVTGA